MGWGLRGAFHNRYPHNRLMRMSRKPIIAQVQGKAIAGGLMLIWPFDIIIASDDAEFSDPVVAFGLNGHEYFVHAWEVGHRKARQMLYTGEPIGAEEAHRLGMVNEIVARDRLDEFTLDMASKVALRPAAGLKLAKMSVNQSQDAQGMWTALQSAFALHQFGHGETGQRGIPGRRIEHGPIDRCYQIGQPVDFDFGFLCPVAEILFLLARLGSRTTVRLAVRFGRFSGSTCGAATPQHEIGIILQRAGKLIGSPAID